MISPILLPIYSSQLISAIEFVESSGDHTAEGDGGLALGILQIHQGVIDDVNRVYQLKWQHKDAFHPLYARMIFRRYMMIYATEARLGRKVTDEDRARIWNGGPNGHLKPHTLAYWEKVRARL